MTTRRLRRRENGHPRPSNPFSTHQRPPTPEAASRSPLSTARGRAPPEHAHPSAPLFLSENLNPPYPAPRLPHPRRDERRPARRETAGFPVCAPQPSEPRRDHGPKLPRAVVPRGRNNPSNQTCNCNCDCNYHFYYYGLHPVLNIQIPGQ